MRGVLSLSLSLSHTHTHTHTQVDKDIFLLLLSRSLVCFWHFNSSSRRKKKEKRTTTSEENADRPTDSSKAKGNSYPSSPLFSFPFFDDLTCTTAAAAKEERRNKILQRRRTWSKEKEMSSSSSFFSPHFFYSIWNFKSRAHPQACGLLLHPLLRFFFISQFVVRASHQQKPAEASFIHS